jgi:hypothetical protein
MAIGNNTTVDNFHAGGIAAPVDLRTGALGRATDVGLATASSTATSTVPRDVSSRSTDRSAVPTSRRPGERLASARRRATSSASD